MRKNVLLFLCFFFILTGGCAGGETKPKIEDNVQEQFVQTEDVARFKLFPTQNIWTFLKLDTQTGQIWQVQYSINDDSIRFEYYLNPVPLVTDDKKVNGRFELCPTQNIYNFILIDQINGKVWQVQWSLDEEDRLVVPIESM